MQTLERSTDYKILQNELFNLTKGMDIPNYYKIKVTWLLKNLKKTHDKHVNFQKTMELCTYMKKLGMT